MNVADCWSSDKLFCDYGAVKWVISDRRSCQPSVTVTTAS